MSTTQTTRPNIAGYPLPLRITSDPIMGEEVVADDGQQIINFADEYDGGFYRELIAKVNRSDALEAALVQVVGLMLPATEALKADHPLLWSEKEFIRGMVKDILRNLGLADRLPGNPSEAEEAVSS